MGKQYNKVEKRRRRTSYLKRKHQAVLAGKPGQPGARGSGAAAT